MSTDDNRTPGSQAPGPSHTAQDGPVDGPEVAANPDSSVPESHELDLPVLERPRDGVPAVLTTPAQVSAAAARLAAGTGLLAVDAERAQGFKYSARAYLFQFRRAGAGTVIIDPVAVLAADPQGLTPLVDALAEPTWVIHAASQDLPCLTEVGLRPRSLIDTELAGRLLGRPRVGLGALVEEYFGVRLLKEHSAANWSTRPIPEEWVNYAALDVELLAELAEAMTRDLAAAGKLEWAQQEFDALAAAPWEHATDPERWRRTSGLHDVRTQLGLAVVRELWRTRDDIAQRLDTAPGRILPDRAMSELATQVKGPKGAVPSATAMRGVEGFRRRQARRFEVNFTQALDRVRALTPGELPAMRTPVDGPPNPRTWQNRHPAAWQRWERVRAWTNEQAERIDVPVANLISPDTLRRLAWEPPTPVTVDSVAAAMAELGARPWQRDLLAGGLAERLRDEDATA